MIMTVRILANCLYSPEKYDYYYSFILKLRLLSTYWGNFISIILVLGLL